MMRVKKSYFPKYNNVLKLSTDIKNTITKLTDEINIKYNKRIFEDKIINEYTKIELSSQKEYQKLFGRNSK